MAARAAALDLVAVRVSLFGVVNNEQQVAASISPPVGDESVVLLAVLIGVNDGIPNFAFFLHDASAFCGFGAAQRTLLKECKKEL